jgi:hypothetical protein
MFNKIIYKAMTTAIKNLKTGDSFKTKTGERIYTVTDIAYSKELDKNIFLLKGGWFVHNPDKEVIKI